MEADGAIRITAVKETQGEDSLMSTTTTTLLTGSSSLDFQLISELSLTYCPSVVESIDEDTAVFGTYELVKPEDRSITPKKVNERVGNLVLVKGSKILQEFECENGGVFDIKYYEKLGGSQMLVAAHSNGVICFYTILNGKIGLSSQIETKSAMLTSINYIITSNRLRLIAGDSVGSVHICSETQVLRTIKASKHAYPIWTLCFVPINANVDIIAVGSDDAYLRLFQLNSFNDKLLLENKNASFGVTALATNVDKVTNEVTLFVGSYDEHLRIYQVIQQAGFQVRIILKQSVLITGGGIWKIRPFNYLDTLHLLVAGMYSGAHILKDGQLICTVKRSHDGQNNHENDDDNKTTELTTNNANNEEAKSDLVYAAVCDQSLSHLFISSFYKKCIYFYRRQLK